MARTRKAPRGRDRAFCKTRHFFFRSLARFCTYTEHVCLGLIHDASVGWGRAEAELSIGEFAAVAGVSDRFVQVALAKLESAEMGWISSRPGKSAGGRRIPTRLYRAKVFDSPAAVDGDVMYAKCSACSTVGVMDLDRGFCMTPHSYFRKLPQRVTRAVWLCVGVILDETVGWNQERATLAIEDFMRDTGLSRRTVQEALADALDLGLIGEEEHSGFASEYWSCPERFAKCPRRPERTVTGTPDAARVTAGASREHLKGEDSAAPASKEPAQDAETTADTCAADFVARPVVRCRSCSSVGPAIVVVDDVVGGATPVPAAPPVEEPCVDARAGPPTAPEAPKRGRPKGETSQWSRLEPELRELYGWLTEFHFAQLPDATVTREIAAALAGADQREFVSHCWERLTYLRRVEHPFKAMVAIARGRGEKYRLDEAARQRQQAALQEQLDRQAVQGREEARRMLRDPALPQTERDFILEHWPELRGES